MGNGHGNGNMAIKQRKLPMICFGRSVPYICIIPATTIDAMGAGAQFQFNGILNPEKKKYTWNIGKIDMRSNSVGVLSFFIVY